MTKLVLGTAVAGVCLMTLACDGTTLMPTEPTALGGGSTTLEAAGTAARPGGVVDADQAVIDLAALPAIVPVGSARLVRTPNGVSFNLSTTGLSPGHAYTLWIVIFNEPGGCAVPHECGPDDVVNAAAKPDMMYAAGSMATAAGTATFAGHRHVGGNGSINAPVGLPAFGLLDPYGAEIHLAVHDHGPRLPEFLPDMIQTVDGGCTDAGIPEAGAPSPWNLHSGFGRRGPNTCATIQASVHRP